MNFWQRRPLGENLVGLLLATGVWLVLELAIDVGLDAAGIGGLTRSRGALLPVLIATILVARLFDRMPLAWTGLGAHPWMARELLVGIGLGSVMATLAWLPGALAGRVEILEPAATSYVVEIFVYLLLGAIVEELIFRGYAFQRLVEILGPVAATTLASGIFAAAHLGNPSISAIALANIALASVFFTLGYFATGSLWLPIAAHAGWNLTLALVLGAPVSGLDFVAGWLRTADGAPVAIGGGAFGPEGGLAATGALIAGIAVLARAPFVCVSPYVHARVFASVYRHERKRSAGRSQDPGAAGLRQ